MAGKWTPNGHQTISLVAASAFRADFSNAQDAAATAGAEGQLFGAEALPQGSGLLVVKRGPNAGRGSCSTTHHDGRSSSE